MRQRHEQWSAAQLVCLHVHHHWFRGQRGRSCQTLSMNHTGRRHGTTRECRSLILVDLWLTFAVVALPLTLTSCCGECTACLHVHALCNSHSHVCAQSYMRPHQIKCRNDASIACGILEALRVSARQRLEQVAHQVSPNCAWPHVLGSQQQLPCLEQQECRCAPEAESVPACDFWRKGTSTLGSHAGCISSGASSARCC